MQNRSLPIITALVFIHALNACTSEPPDTTMDEKPSAEESLSTKSTDETFIGLDEKAAQTLAKDQKLHFRVTKRDGTDLPATMDYRPDRINATIEDGKITATSRG